MGRPTIPPSWRGLVAASAALPFLFLLPFLLHLAGGASVGADFIQFGLPLVGLALGSAILFHLFRAGRRERIGAVGAIALAVLAGAIAEVPFLALGALGFAAPLAVLVARPDPAPTLLAAGGYAAWLVLLAMQMIAREAGVFDDTIANAIGVAAMVAMLTGFATYAARVRVDARATRPPSPRTRVGIVAGGMALLALSFAIGGHVFFLPIWPLAFVLVVAPALLRWRAWPAGALVVAAIAGVGLAPVGDCTADPWSDAVGPGPADADAYPERATLYELAGNGPQWASGGGFAGVRVQCPPLALSVAAVWALALGVAAARVAYGRPSATP